MTQNRPWIPLFLAGCAWTQVLVAQTGGGFGGTGGTTGTTTGGTTTGGTTAPRGGTQGTTQETQDSEVYPGTGGKKGTATKPGTRGAPKTGTAGGTQPGNTASGILGGTTPGGTTKPSDPFGFGDPTAPVLPFGAAADQGASTTFGADPRNAAPKPESEQETVPLQPPAEAPSYTAPSFYGSARQIFSAGQGRFARPKFRYGVSMGIGFDDNTFQTPDNPEDIPKQVVEQVIPAEPEIAVFQPRRELAGFRNQPRPDGSTVKVPVYRTVQTKIVLRPAQPEQVVETEVPGIDFGERQSSVVSRLDLNMDVQWANPRTVFTMDLRGGAEYYWSRDETPLEYNASFATMYLRRISPRVQVSANANLSYQSQPDYSQVNLIDAATAPGSDSSYFAGSAKLDLSYRWSARFSTVTSLSGNTVLYQGDRKSSSFWETTLGNEFRYIQSRKTTWVADLRYSQLQYLEGVIGAINTAYLLVGSDWSLSRKLRTTIRLGESLRTFEDGGKTATPYGEFTLIYQPDRRNQFSLSGRHGFEQTTNVTDENLVTRFSLAYTRTFSPRLVGSLTGNYVENQVTSAGGVNSQTQIYDTALYFQYTFNRHFSLNARYSYTLSNTSNGTNDYDRGRFFLTGRYDF